jgi:hypothetical protein
MVCVQAASTVVPHKQQKQQRCHNTSTTPTAAQRQQQHNDTIGHNALTTHSLLFPFNGLSDFGSLASDSKAYAAATPCQKQLPRADCEQLIDGAERGGAHQSETLNNQPLESR